MKKRPVSRPFLVGLIITLAFVCWGFVSWQNESIRRANWEALVLSVRSQYVATAKSHKVHTASPLLIGPPTPGDAVEMAIQQEIQKLQVADPIVDFEKAWQQGDHRFAALNQGVGLGVPSAKGQISTDLLNKYNVKIICSPGDVVFEGIEELGQMGDNYAKSYNQLLLKKLNLG